MKAISLISLVFVVFTGCVHTHTLRQTEQDYAALNNRAQQQDATIVLDDGQRFAAKALHMATDSTSWINPETGEDEVVSTTEVDNIRFNPKEISVLTGLVAGAMGGMLAGGAIGYAMGDDPPGTWMRSSARDKAQFMGFLVGVPGALLGLIYGMGEDVYRPERKPVQNILTGETEK